MSKGLVFCVLLSLVGIILAIFFVGWLFGYGYDEIFPFLNKDERYPKLVKYRIKPYHFESLGDGFLLQKRKCFMWVDTKDWNGCVVWASSNQKDIEVFMRNKAQLIESSIYELKKQSKLKPKLKSKPQTFDINPALMDILVYLNR